MCKNYQDCYKFLGYARLALWQLKNPSFYSVFTTHMFAIWWGDIICHLPPHFLFRFCIWRGSKIKSDVCHVLREVLFMLDVTQSQVDDETEFPVSLDTYVVSLSLISLDSVGLSILASIKWYLAFIQLQRPRKMVYCFCPTFYPV